MQNIERIKNMNITELSSFLIEFTSRFYTESIQDICNIECNQSENSCESCIKQWLASEDGIIFKQ